MSQEHLVKMVYKVQEDNLEVAITAHQQELHLDMIQFRNIRHQADMTSHLEELQLGMFLKQKSKWVENNFLVITSNITIG